MIHIEVDEKIVKEIIEKVEEVAKQKYYISYNELSSYLNMSKPSIEKYLIKNGLKYYKKGSKYLFKRDEVDTFLNEITSNMRNTNNDFRNIEKIEIIRIND